MALHLVLQLEELMMQSEQSSQTCCCTECLVESFPFPLEVMCPAHSRTYKIGELKSGLSLQSNNTYMNY